MMCLETDITYVTESCQLYIIRLFDFPSRCRLKKQYKYANHSGPLAVPLFLPLKALAESLFVQLLLPALHQQKQRDGWPSAVVLEAVAGGG